MRITFNLVIESTDNVRSIVNNVGRALVKKKLLMLGLKDIDTIGNSDIYESYKDLYLSKKQKQKKREDKLLQGIQLASGLKTHASPRKADDTALTVIKGLQYC